MNIHRSIEYPHVINCRFLLGEDFFRSLLEEVFSPKIACGLLFWMYTTVPVASAYKDKGRSRSVIMALAASQIILFFLSATPFY